MHLRDPRPAHVAADRLASLPIWQPLSGIRSCQQTVDKGHAAAPSETCRTLAATLPARSVAVAALLMCQPRSHLSPQRRRPRCLGGPGCG